MNWKYTRLYADKSGESHFEDIETELAPAAFVSSALPLYLSEALPAEHTSFFGAPAGWSSDWHPSQARNLFVVMTGQWEIESSDGEVRTIGPHQTLLVEDTNGKGHRSRVLAGEDSVSLLVTLREDHG